MAKKKKAARKSSPAAVSDDMMVPIDAVHPWKRNPRKNEKAVAKIVASLREFGWVRPIIANSHPKARGEIIVGHTARLAAIEMGQKEVPVRWISLAPKLAHAAAVADNKLGEVSKWDAPELAALLTDGEISRELFAIGGFTEGELDRLIATHGGTDGPPPPEEPPAKPTTKLGDLYTMGRHRLLCGDSTKPENVQRVLNGAQPYLMVTDPPYGVEYDPGWRETGKRLGAVLNDDRADWTPVWKNSPATVGYVWHAGKYASVVSASLEAAEFEIRQQIIWGKPGPVLSRCHYHYQHEPCWYVGRKGKPMRFTGGRQQSTLWTIDEEELDRGVEGGHSTQKPVECMARPIRNHEGDVFEPFCGSGTTIIAAQTLDRACFALELSPAYCDAIVARWEKMTGEKAERERSK